MSGEMQGVPSTSTMGRGLIHNDPIATLTYSFLYSSRYSLCYALSLSSYGGIILINFFKLYMFSIKNFIIFVEIKTNRLCI